VRAGKVKIELLSTGERSRLYTPIGFDTEAGATTTGRLLRHYFPALGLRDLVFSHLSDLPLTRRSMCLLFVNGDRRSKVHYDA